MHKASDKIKHLLTDINHKTELAYEPSNHCVNGYRKIDVYNKTIKSPLQKIWIKLPKAKLLTNLLYGDSLTYKIDIALAPITTDVKNLIKYIEELEKNIYTEINKQYPNLEHKSSFKRKDDYIAVMVLKLQKKHDKPILTCYDCNNLEIQPKNIETGSLVSTYVELSGIWINDTEAGFSWNILQMKTYPVFDFNRCLFDDEEPEIQIPVSSTLPNVPILPAPVPFSNQHKQIEPLSQNIPTNKPDNIKPPISFMPSASMLQSIKSNLKKINSLDETNNEPDNEPDNESNNESNNEIKTKMIEKNPGKYT